MDTFSASFKKLIKQKGFQSSYQLSIEASKYDADSPITQVYLSKLVNNPILEPQLKTRQRLAKVFAAKNNTLYERELEDVNLFFRDAQQKFGKPNNKINYSIKLEFSDKSIVSYSVQQINHSLKKEILDKKADHSFIKGIVKTMNNLTQEPIEFVDVKEGCIALYLESSPEAFENLLNLHQQGKLSDLLGVDVLNLQLDEERNIQSNLEYEDSDRSGFKWVQSQIQSSQNIREQIKKIWQELKIPILPDNIAFPPGLELVGVRREEVTRKGKTIEKWDFSKIEIQELDAILIIWFKPDVEEFDLSVQLYTSENQEVLTENIQLKLYSDNECLETLQSKKSDLRLCSDTYTFEWDESVKIQISYENFQLIQNLHDLVL
jgi:hypothetical protein